MLEQALGDRAINRDFIGACACEFARFAIGGCLAWKECGAIDRVVGDAAWNAFGAKRTDEAIARQAERGFVDEKNKCIDDFARDAWIARDRRQSLDCAEAFTDACGGAALVFDLFRDAPELRQQHSP